MGRVIPWGEKRDSMGRIAFSAFGSFYLPGPDLMMEKLEKRYLRYMDDILILAPTKWELWKAIRVLNKTFNESGLEQHPDKTLIGRIKKGFSFLGYFLKPNTLSFAKKTIKQFKTYIARLYEQGADINRIRDYVKKCLRRVNGFRANKNGFYILLYVPVPLRSLTPEMQN
jgi:RNA-directed DNA polymerase